MLLRKNKQGYKFFFLKKMLFIHNLEEKQISSIVYTLFSGDLRQEYLKCLSFRQSL